MADLKKGKMKAVQWEGKPFSVSVNEVDIPKITDPLDVIIRITSAAICGSDLHTYRGRDPGIPPMTFGHENIGIIEDIGQAITTLKIGDRVVVNSSLDQLTEDTEAVLFTVPGSGTEGLLPQINGGQAQFMRVPFGNANLIKLPPGDAHELDYLLLADIWPTAWSALDFANQVVGDTVVVFGAGPVGLLCAYSAIQFRGAIRVYSVDNVPERLAKAKSIGAIPIDFSRGDPVAQILKYEPNGVDRACDCVGFECVDAKGNNVENLVLTQAVNVTRMGGGLGIIGVYLPKDPKPAMPSEKTGVLPFPIGTWWFKGQTIRGGIALVRESQELLKTLIERDNAKPSFVFDREFRIEDGAEAFKAFEAHRLIKAVFRFDTKKKGLKRKAHYDLD